MLKAFLMICAAAGAVALAACSTDDVKNHRGETVGTAGGAVAGGAVGSAATGGSTLGTLGGAAIGGVVGNRVGEDYDKKHPR
jgi:osmotically inducible lipoprotein OsmB